RSKRDWSSNVCSSDLALGGLGAYNLRQETFAEARLVGGEEMKLHYHDRDTTCLKCPVACGKQYAIADGEFAGTKAKMPEYETIRSEERRVGKEGGDRV